MLKRIKLKYIIIIFKSPLWFNGGYANNPRSQYQKKMLMKNSTELCWTSCENEWGIHVNKKMVQVSEVFHFQRPALLKWNHSTQKREPRPWNHYSVIVSWELIVNSIKSLAEVKVKNFQQFATVPPLNSVSSSAEVASLALLPFQWPVA